MAGIFPRQHIQNHSDTSVTHQKHWGYPDRLVPCKNDAGTCAYLDGVYWMHDVSILYSWIMWVVIGGILLLWLAVRVAAPKKVQSRTDSEAAGMKAAPSTLRRLYRTVATFRQRHLLPEMWPKLFGRVSRLQLTILAVISGYLLVFSLVGIVYKTWVTPIKALPGQFNTRTGIGGFGNRVGILAYALTPLTVALSSRESVLSLITGIAYQHFNFLHRWSGRIIYIQSVLHTIMWTVVQANLYQPQPKQYRNFIRQQYMIFGCVATLAVSFLFFFSLRPVIRWTGYEFFRKTHYVVALIYIATCWGHWTKLACWMIPSLALFFIDRGLRLVRTAWIHYGKKDGSSGIGFRGAEASIARFDDGEASVVRLDFVHDRGAWNVGQHFFLCFPELTVWQSHPMTPASIASEGKTLKHTYIIRATGGETRRLADLALNHVDEKTGVEKTNLTTSVVLSGPYGRGVLADHAADNVLAVAGGTGISFALPIIQQAIAEAKQNKRHGAIELIWMIRKTENVAWIAEELGALRSESSSDEVDLQIKIFVTRDTAQQSSASSVSSKSSAERKEVSQGVTAVVSTSSSHWSSLITEVPGFSIEWLSDHHPNLKNVDGSSMLEQWLARGAANGGRFQVFASGPPGLGTDLRVAVAAKNDAGRVWKGDAGADVGFYWDDRFS